MSLTNRSFTLFPHTVASEEDCRALCILLPAVSVLKIIEPPAVPRWAEYCVVIENALADPELEKKVRLQMKGYKNLAEVVGDGDLIASLGWENDRGGEDVRQIRGRLLDGREADVKTGEKLLTEAALVLEMARDLDERDIELQKNIDHAGVLEDEFREILGIADDEVEETSVPLNLRLVPEREYLSYMLERRAVCRLRLHAFGKQEGFPFPVCIAPDFADQIMDIVETRMEQEGKPWTGGKTALPSVPVVRGLPPESLAAIPGLLNDGRILAVYHESLGKALESPKDTAVRNDLAESAALVFAALDEVFEDEEVVIERVPLSLVEAGCTWGELWGRLDKEGHEAFGNEFAGKDLPVKFLCLGGVNPESLEAIPDDDDGTDPDTIMRECRRHASDGQ